MNKKFVLFVFWALSHSGFAQSVPKYALLEHFTNSRCSNCAANNPAFYNVVGSVFGADAHHIAIHPHVPYNSCIFYQANTTEQSARAAFYGVVGTPVVSVNGAAIEPITNITVSMLNAEGAKRSPIGIQVTETLSGGNIQAQIKVHTFGMVPPGSYKLYAAQVLKRVNQATPNGESIHYDVFRKWMMNDGVTFTPAAIAHSVTIQYSYPNETMWGSNENYLLVFVQETQSKEILNSGTKFDPALNTHLLENQTMPVAWQVYPNPTSSELRIDFMNLPIEQYAILDAQGQIIENQYVSKQTIQCSVAHYPKGIYWIRATTAMGIVAKSFIVQ